MFHVVLFQPEIPPNTGNVIRLCANTGCDLHLIEPLGFTPDDKKLKRAGLDYSDWQRISKHQCFESFLDNVTINRVITLSTKHRHLYTQCKYQAGDALVFGPETRGLPIEIRDSAPEELRLTLPMRPNNRSLNLSNAVAIVVYEAWRQLGFADRT